MFSPTDTIAQHIHPVKFDVMAPAGQATAGTTTPGSSGRTAEGTDRREHPLPGLCWAEASDPPDVPGGRGDGGRYAEPCPDTLPADPVKAEHTLEDCPWCRRSRRFNTGGPISCVASTLSLATATEMDKAGREHNLAVAISRSFTQRRPWTRWSVRRAVCVAGCAMKKKPNN